MGRLEAETIRQRLTREQMEELKRSLSLPGESEDQCRYCRSGRSSFWLCWDGTLLPCGMLPQPGASVPELGFAKAWETVRDAVSALRYPPACAECRYRELCHICLAKCYCETLGFDRPPAYPCAMTKALLEELGIPNQLEVPS